MVKTVLHESWSDVPQVITRLEEVGAVLSTAQKKLQTPILVNSTTLEILKDAYMQLFKRSGTLYTPSAFRYSYSFRVKGKNIMATSKFHLERDFNMMKTKYNIDVHHATLQLTGTAWEREAYKNLKWISGNCKQTAFKLIKTKGADGLYYGWEFPEVFSDRPAK